MRDETIAWAERVKFAWRRSVEGILEAGAVLIEAKKALPHGKFQSMVESELPFSSHTAQRLMTIARDPRLSNPAHALLLPPSWMTIFALSRLSDAEFASAIANGKINPGMERSQVAPLRANFKPRQPKKPKKLQVRRADGKIITVRVGHSTARESIESERAERERVHANFRLQQEINAKTQELQEEFEERVEAKVKERVAKIETNLRSEAEERRRLARQHISDGFLTRQEFEQIYACLDFGRRADRVITPEMAKRFSEAIKIFDRLNPVDEQVDLAEETVTKH